MKLKILVVSLLIFSFVLLGCPKVDPVTVEKAAAATVRLPSATNELVLKVEEAYFQQIITQEQKNAFVGNLRLMAQGTVGFRKLVETANETVQRDGKLPDAEFAKLFAYFNANVVKHFTDVLTTLKLISGENAQFLALAATAVRTLLDTIARSFKPKNLKVSIPPVQLAFKPG